MGYGSFSNPNYLELVIHPTLLDFDGMRGHVRGYCEKNQGYRDFVLGRFQPDTPEQWWDGEDKFDIQEGVWHNLLNVGFRPIQG